MLLCEAYFWCLFRSLAHSLLLSSVAQVNKDTKGVPAPSPPPTLPLSKPPPQPTQVRSCLTVKGGNHPFTAITRINSFPWLHKISIKMICLRVNDGWVSILCFHVFFVLACDMQKKSIQCLCSLAYIGKIDDPLVMMPMDNTMQPADESLDQNTTSQ